MKRFLKFEHLIIISVGFFVLSLTLLFLNSFSARAGDGYVYLDSPSTSNTTIEGIYNFSGHAISMPSWAGFEIYMSPSWVTLCQVSNPGTLTFNCSKDTTIIPNGTSYSIRARATVMGTDHVSDAIMVTIYNNSITQPTPTPDGGSSGGGSGIKGTPPPKVNQTTPHPSSSPNPATSNPNTTISSPTPRTTVSQVPIPGRTDLSPIPVSVPLPTPIQSPVIRDLVTNSNILGTLNFKLDQNKPLHLESLESRQAPTQEKFIYLTGKSYPDTIVTLKIFSQPIVMTTQTDSSGNWSYTLEKPLDPGNHQVYVEVNNNGTVESSGPYPFTVAQAQASSDNPTGASLDIVDPQKQALKNYLLISAGIVVAGLIVVLIIFYRKRTKKLPDTNQPMKEGSGV